MRAKIEAFRTKKEVIKAQYSAAEAQVKIGEAASGVGEQMADLGLAMQRAEDKTEQMRARAGAVEELEAAGTFDDITQLGPPQDDIDKQLARAQRRLAGGRRAGEDEGRAGRGRRRAETPALERGRQGAAAMIVRISGEGQYELADDQRERLNELDNQAVAAVEAGRRGRSSRALGQDARARDERGQAAGRRRAGRSPT